MKPFHSLHSFPWPSRLAGLLSVVATLGFAGIAAAQDEPKVAVVDIARIFKEYYRTRELDAKITEAHNTYESQLDEHAQAHHRLVEEIARIDKALGDPGLSAPARDDRQKERDKAAGEMQQLEQETKEFKATHERGIQEMTQRGRTQLVEDIMVVVNARVETRHYDLILNRSAKGMGLRDVVLYANDALDITDDVLTALNKNRPALRPLLPTPPPPRG